MRHARLWLVLFLVGFLGWTTQPAAQQPNPAAATDEPDPEEARDRAAAERFRRVLETNPRRGTAFDRLYGYHVERGLLDQLVAQYQDRTKKNAQDGVAWMILGLLESQRGRDAAAIAAFRQAETHRPSDAIPPYYLGQSLLLLGQPDAAAEAFERAIQRKPGRNDLLDIFQALGRVYQRAQRTDKALDVWNRLEKLFPDDLRVQDQIATTLVEEGQFELALPRLVKLAEQADDKYRQASLRMDIADLKVKLKRAPEALADFEKLLGELNPESWIHREVRRRIEEVFLRNDDLAGLARYYEKWLEKRPTDVDAIARLVRTLTTQGRAPEARQWLSKGIAAAPSHRGLRQGLIDQYVAEQNFAAAAREYEAMDKVDPNNPDTLREWGKVLLRDSARPEAERRSAAAAVWKRLLEKKPNDAVVAAQVADLLRSAGATDEAIALYRKAIDLAPTAPQYREYLGEYLHSMKRSEEALATWRPMAEGPNRTAKNLARLAEVFAGFGYRKEAVAALADAISLEKDDFTLLMTYADLLYQESRHDEALAQLTQATRLISSPEEAEQVLVAQIKVYQATDALGARIDALKRELDAGQDATAERWLRLARYYEANRQGDRANEIITKALEKDPRSIPALTAAARIYESAGNLLAAADVNRTLATLDRRFRSEYLTAVAKLEQRLGRRAQALQAARDLLAASPGNPDVYKFFAELCFQLGDQDEGLEALRRSVRANPSDPQGLITLANALAERVRQGEAIELLWRAFEKTTELDARLGVVERLTQLYLENNQFDRLLERLERERSEADKAREATLCIAQAYTTAGDLGTARQQLERLLTENTRDTHLLGQLSTLCEQEGDLAAALKYQRLLTLAAPNNYDHQLRLAQILTRSGEADEAADIWVRLVSKESEAHRNLAAIDALLTAGKQEAALAILARMLAQKPGNWELLYREGAALANRGRVEEASARFAALLALRLPDDELGEIARHRMEEAKRRAKAQNPARPASTFAATGRFDDWTQAPLTRRTSNPYQLRAAIGMDAQGYYANPGQPFYVPNDVGEARMACLGWLYEFARARDGGDAYLKRLREARDQAGNDLRPVWDWYYLQVLRNESRQVLPAALALSKGGDPAGLLAYLQALPNRGGPSAQRARRAGPDAKDSTPPLSAEELAHVLACHRKLEQVRPEWLTSDVVSTVMTELKRAGREDDEKALYQDLLRKATTVARVQQALNLAAERNDLAACQELFARLEKLQPAIKTSASLTQLPTRQLASTLVTLMGRRADDRQFGDVRQLLDLFLATARRQNLATPKSTTTSRRPQAGGLGITLYSRSRSYNQTQIQYPSPNDYYDASMLTVLYNAFDLHKKGDLLSDLFAHLQEQLATTRGAERLYVQLALGYLHWWAGERDEALAQLTDATRSVPGDHGLILEVAALREQNNEFTEALALLDAVTPLDTQVMQRREEAALRLAERAGNVERARQAADRLFGLRLDADKQLELAGKMHRLGMHDMAETVLNRAQRQAGSKTATLVRLMVQYQNQNQGELAVQIARQILRRGAPAPSPYRGSDDGSTARNQAIGVLARSGQLREMIDRAEAQLKASPRSIQIQQALINYYQAAGEKQKLKDAVQRLAQLKPEDGALQFQVAQQLQQMGDRNAALEAYKRAIKVDPTQFANRYYEIQNLFAQANRFEELGQLLDEIDFRKVGRYYTVTEPIASLLQHEKTRPVGLKLFKKAWEAFPQYRGYVLGRLHDEAVWRLPEIYDYARQAVIPRDEGDIDPWQCASDIMSYQGEGRLETVLTRLLTIARKQQRLPELRTEVKAALERQPAWTAGKVLLAVLDIQSGAKEQGKRQWQAILDDPKATVPALARFVFCQELEFYAGVEDLAIRSLEAGIDEVIRDGQYEFNYSPGRRLVWWYNQLGRKEDARKLLLRIARTEAIDPGYGGGYWQYRQVRNGISVAQELLRVGDPVEAVRVYNQLLTDREVLDLANQYYGGERFDQQVEAGLQAAVRAIKPSTLPTAVGTLLTPREKPTPDQPVLDLVILVESRELPRTALNCLFAAAIKASEKKPEIRKEALARVADLSARYSADVSVQTAAVVAAFGTGAAPEATRPAVERLVKLMHATPLDPLPASARPNARHRAQAALQVPLWIAARECLAKDRKEFWSAGEQLAARAVAAARRQQNPLQAIAILREWGQLELERGSPAQAEVRWAELLELALPKPAPARRSAAPAAPPAAPTAPPPAAPESAARAVSSLLLVAAQPIPVPPLASAAPARGNQAAPTEEQFQRAYEVALLAIDKGLPALSLRAMHEAVRNGPPIPSSRPNRGGGYLTSRTINGVQYYVEAGNEPRISVDQALVALVPKWQGKKVPPATIYEVLAAAVLPEARPSEVFPYTETRITGTIYSISSSGTLIPATDVLEASVEDRGLGKLLVEVAVQAARVDDLRTRLEARARLPLGELAARVLLAALALHTRDEARGAAALQALGDRLEKDSQQVTSTAVSTVVVPALADPKFAELAAPLVEKLARNFAIGGNPMKAAELRFKLAAHYLGRNNVEAARAQFKIVAGFANEARRGSYDPHLPLAQQYLKAGWTEDALRALGQHIDRITVEGADPRSRARRGEPSLGTDFARLVALLLEMPPDRRYQALKAWSLPTPARRSVRYVVDVTPRHVPGPAFGKRGPIPADQVVSTMLLLADAAREAGTLAELTAEADRLAAEKVENADLLRALVYLAQGKGKAIAPDLEAYAAAARQRILAQPQQPIGSRYYYEETRQPKQVRPSEFLFVSLCLADPAVAAIGEGVLTPMRGLAESTNNIAYLSRIRALEDQVRARRAGAPAAAETLLPPRWYNASARTVWLAQDGYLVQARNDQPSFLLFDTPLTGTFEFSVESYQGLWAEGHVGYGGVVFEPNRQGVGAQVWLVGQRDQVARVAEGMRDAEFNRLTLQVAPGKVRCLVNGRLFYEDTEPPPTSPWLMLVAGSGRRPVFRNATLTGKPEVPAEVRLSGGSYLDGWMTHVHGGALPPRLQPKEPKDEQVFDRWGNFIHQEARTDPVYDWEAKDGEILGRKLDRSAGAVPSKLAYFRPLRPGESLRYEFYYQPGKTHVHPSLGRLAFLLEPEGVKLPWLTDRPTDDWTGLAADHAVDPPQGRRGGKLPLRTDAWNTLALTTTDDGVSLSLNGAVVYEAKLPPDLERMFGLFHYRDRTAVRVRNVVLTGTWPRSLGGLDAVAIAVKPATPAEAKARRTLIGERYFATEAGERVARARQLPARERYQALADWVLPTHSRPVFQVAGVLRPQDDIQVGNEKSLTPQSGEISAAAGRRLLLAGKQEVPCLEMIEAAREAGMLDELRQRVASAASPAEDEAFRQARTSLLAIVQAAQGRDAEAAATLASLVLPVQKLPLNAPGQERWPALVALLGMPHRPALLEPLNALALSANRHLEQAQSRQVQVEERDWWLRAFRAARAAIELRSLPAGAANPFVYWTSQPALQANNRSQGWGVPRWALRDGAVVHFPGHSQDYLLLNTPLRGDFEVTCELKLQGWQEARVGYGGYQFDLNYDRKKYRMHTTIRQGSPEVTITPPLPPAKGNTYQFRMVVKDGWLRAFVDGREMASEKTGPHPDPWLTLYCTQLNTGEVRDLRILGKPTVPEEVDLLARDDLAFWRPHMPGGMWSKRGEELYHEGSKPEPPEDGRPLPPRSNPEAALHYQRPLVEDGVIEYEFYYEPDKALVHPVLDRLAFLLQPEGVRLHWLTDGPHGKSQVPVDNVSDEPTCRRGPSQLPLTPRAWNRVRLEVAGDVVKLALNGVAIYERSIEPTNQRLFGLFHYVDESEARVRSMVYRGAWPRQRPANERLFEQK